MRVVLAVVVVLVFSLIGGPGAVADPGLVVGDGAAVAPGATVSAQMGCEEPTTAPAGGPGVSGSPWLRDPEGHQPWSVTSTLTVAPDAAPGPVTVTATCGDRPLTATLLVGDAGSGTTVRLLVGGAILLVVVAAMVLLQRRRRASTG